MAQYRITGKTPLHGELTVSGRKNAAIKMIAASLLSEETVVLRRVPDIGDVRTMCEILRKMGATVDRQDDEVYAINTSGVREPVIPAKLGHKLRASLVMVGPLLARFGKAEFPHPGGCVIGKRSIGPHLLAFERLGAKVEFDGELYHISSTALRGSEIYLPEATVTGTENLIMASTRAHGTTIIYNAAQEPHIVNLCDMLREMGYDISGDGSSTVRINGRPDQVGLAADVEVIPDDIEVGTYAVASLVTQGDVTLNGVGGFKLLMPILAKLDEFNARYEYDAERQTLRLLPSPDLQGATIRPQPWPNFPTDLGSVFAILATQAHGTSHVHEWMFEGRLTFLEQVQAMGADILIADPHRAIIEGPTALVRHSVITPDLRAGAALILAALAAEGESVIEHVELIERGYVRIDEKLRSIGASIVREED